MLCIVMKAIKVVSDCWVERMDIQQGEVGRDIGDQLIIMNLTCGSTMAKPSRSNPTSASY